MAAQFAAGMTQGLMPIRCDMCSIRTLPCAYCNDSLVRMVPPGYTGQSEPSGRSAEPSSDRSTPRRDDNRRHQGPPPGSHGSHGVCSKGR